MTPGKLNRTAKRGRRKKINKKTTEKIKLSSLSAQAHSTLKRAQGATTKHA